jgi:hypothetical protein
MARIAAGQIHRSSTPLKTVPRLFCITRSDRFDYVLLRDPCDVGLQAGPQIIANRMESFLIRGVIAISSI